MSESELPSITAEAPTPLNELEMKTTTQNTRFRLRNEAGQTFVEYALVLSVIVVGVLLAATMAGLTAAITGAINIVINAL
jgi:Flp pilus assembly pilin Flp